MASLCWPRAGAQVDFERQIAIIPEKIVRKALNTTPSEFWLYDIDGQPAVHYGSNRVHFDPGSSGVSILADEYGQQRSPNSDDFIRFVKLVETLTPIDAQSTAFVCRDVAEGIGDLYRLYLALNYLHKPIVTGAFTVQGWWAMYEMLTLVTGGRLSWRQNHWRYSTFVPRLLCCGVTLPARIWWIALGKTCRQS